MNSAERAHLLQVLRERCQAIADNWYRAIGQTSFVSLSAAEVRQRLAELTEQAIALLLAEHFDPCQAEAIGAAMAGLHYIQPEALGRMQEALAHQLLEDLPADQVVALQPRLIALLGRLATGFFRQAVEIILVEQEQIRSAVDHERQRAQEALARERNLLRTLIDHLPDFIYVKDTQGRFVIGNIAMAHLVGHIMGATTPDAFLGKTDFDYCPPDLARQYYADEQEIMRSGQPLLNREEPFIDPVTGKRGWISTTKVPLRDHLGKIVGIVGMGRDITVRKQAEEELRNQRDHLEEQVRERTAELRRMIEQLRREITARRRAEKALQHAAQQWRATFDAINDALCLLDMEGRVRRCNEAMINLVGKSFSEIIGHTCCELVHGTPEPIEGCPYVRMRKTRRRESMILCRGERWYEVTIDPLLDEEGHLTGAVHIMTDITERRQAEEALRESEATARALLNAPTDAAALVDTRGIILDVNETMARRLGRRKDELIGRYGWDLIPPDVAKRRKAYVDQVIQSGKPVRFEDERQGIWYDNVFHPVLDAQGKVTKVALLARDITERVRAEETLRRSLEETARSHRLLLAISQAAQAVQRALTIEEIYHVVGEEVKRLGYHAVIFTLTEDRARLLISHLTFEPALGQEVKKLTGLSTQDYCFLTPGGFFHRAITERETIFTDQAAEYIAATLPEPMRHLADQIAALLGLEQSIVAPLIVSGEAYGLLAVTGIGLSEADIPAVTVLASQAAIAIENAQLLDAVTKHERELQSLSVQLISIQEAERRRISRELHDEMGQALTAMRINLAAMEKELPPECPPTIRERLAETSWLAERTLEQMRKLSHDLRPNILDDLGLVPALHWYTDRYTKRLNIEVELEAIDFEERLPVEMETALYRIVQEALTNVAKHAQANRVSIRLERKKSMVTAFIEDDGRGFDVQEIVGREGPERGMGLIGMRERVTSLGGSLNIQSRPGQGTRLTIEIPLRTAPSH